MDDLGAPSSYVDLVKGVSVYSSDGERLGEVEYVLADGGDDIFDGIVLDTSSLPGGRRFVDAPEVDRIFERGVVLKIDAAAAESLPKPSANPASVAVHPGDIGREGALQRKLKRAWDLISGNY
ncbi:MAG TPA: PRC-barrel domain-containing protein [Solirubrobacterales bacterium]|nr:PRC-barrel domain-containing protein [Solirubrobacterales bacterium]